MKKFACCFLLLFMTFLSSLFSQKESNNWYFGNFAAITFNTKSGSPVALRNDKLNTCGGSATVSDKNGNLLFYTDGNSIWNRKHQIMLNGTDLIGSGVWSEIAIIVPFPSNNKLYYIFTVDQTCVNYYNFDSSRMAGFVYSIVDMSLDKGYGGVTEKNISIHKKSTEKLTAVKHANNKDIWVMIHDWGSNDFLAYLITKDGIRTQPVISSAGLLHSRIRFPSTYDLNGVGCMKFSLNTKKLAVDIFGLNTIEIFDFDNSTGKVSNPITLKDSTDNDLTGPIGVEFSPDASKLYVTTFDSYGKLLFFDLASGLADTIVKNRKLLSETSGTYGQLQMGPDNKIYCSHYGISYLGVINKPNFLSDGCGFVEDGQSLGANRCGHGLPQTIQCYPKIDFIGISCNSPVCEGDSILFFVNNILDDSISTYQWTGPDYFISGDKNPKIINSTIKNKGWYYFTYVSSDTYFSDSVFVDVYYKPNAEMTIIGDSVLCRGDSVILTVKNIDLLNNSYEWSTGETSTSIVVSNSGNFRLKVTSNLGCKDSSTVKISVLPMPKVRIYVDGSTNLCMGDSTILTAMPNDNRKYSYKWSNGETTQQIVAKSALIYKVVMSDECGNADSSEVQILKFDFIALIKQISKLCSGHEAFLIALPNLTGFKYLWTTGDTTDRITITKPGKYSVILTWDNFCSDTAEIDIAKIPTPVLTLAGDSLICPGVASTLSVHQDFVSYLWNTKETTKQISITQPGNYSVTVTDTNGCTGTANFEVKEFIFKLSGLTDLDFGKQVKGTSISKTLTLKNESNAEINISRIFTKSNSPEFQIKTVTVLPSKLKQNETIEIEIAFTPLEFKEFQDSLIVETDAPCKNEISSRLFGKTGAKTLVFLPDTTGAVGTKDYCLPLFAVLSESTSETLSYSARIKFSAGLFEPDNIYSSFVLGSERFVDLKGDNITITNRHTKLGEFCGTILLADQDRTPLIIDNFEWSNIGIENEKRDGSLTILGICARNISRLKLFQSDEITLSPNPAGDFIEISVGAQGSVPNNSDILIFNVFGVIVSTSVFSADTSASGGQRIDVSGLSSGIYFVRIGSKVGKFVKY